MMLSRLRLKRTDFRFIVRCLSDKPSDNDGKIPDPTAKIETTDKSKPKDSATEKIQELLKSMMTQPKIPESEYEDKFVKPPQRQRKLKEDEIEVKREKIEESITKAATEVAEAIGGDVKQNEAELLSKVLGKINQTSTSLSDLLVGMKVDRSTEREEAPRETRGQQVKRLVSQSRQENQTRYSQRKTQTQTQTKHRQTERQAVNRTQSEVITTNIFSGQPLGIFKPKEPNYGTKLDVWEELKLRELNLATAQPPANYFQKMILWTEQGKVWRFPIDNEQGIEEEQEVPFTEHVFLDAQLEGWCPRRGPVRHFMELVCVGLSKNAFYTAQEKRDHILWYKEYFESKKSLLQEVGAWESSAAGSKEAST